MKPLSGVNFNKVRVVWNLTNRCPFKCPMCVASANTRIENIDKNAILESILTFPKENISIDFSGGDPLYLKEDINIVKKASEILGKDNISISSTGLSISKLTDTDLISISTNYDMTYDFPKKYCDDDIRGKQYNTLNFEQCIRLKKLGCNVDIFIPIRNIPNEYYDDLAKDICEINPNSVKLLKCMPFNEKFDTEKINNQEIVPQFIEYIKKYNYKGKICINCALKEDFNEDNNCNMLTERKIGLDQFGNLYTCIWASDLLIDIDTNPFYLGNLLESKLSDILNSSKLFDYLNEINKDRNKCHVLKFYKNRRQ